MQTGKLAIDLIRTILIREMSLDAERVNIYNQKWKIPATEGLFITVEYRGAPKIVSSRSTVVDNGADMIEYQDLNVKENVVVGVFSRNTDALVQKENVLMSLSSVYSQQIQEANSFKIFTNLGIEDVSALEGAGILYRFDISAVIHAWYNRTTKPDYYDSFSVRVRVNDGDPDMVEEFNVNEAYP